MLRLISCEFAKLKRKKFILLVVLSAFLFPVPLTILMIMSQKTGQYDSNLDIFNDYFQFVMGYGVELLLPCMIGVIAAILFFMKRDNDTFKNLRTIPVTSTQMILAKIIVLFFFGIVFSLTSALIAILCGGMICFCLWLRRYVCFRLCSNGEYLSRHRKFGIDQLPKL